MNRYDILLQHQPLHPATDNSSAQSVSVDEPLDASADVSPSRLESPPTQRSTAAPITESTEPSTHTLTAFVVDRGANETVGRPKAFYITTRLNKRLDEAVRYFQDVWGIKKVDRSAIVNVMLDTDSHWTNEALDQCADRLVRLLASRLTG